MLNIFWQVEFINRKKYCQVHQKPMRLFSAHLAGGRTDGNLGLSGG
jgi:hypothetical protein